MEPAQMPPEANAVTIDEWEDTGWGQSFRVEVHEFGGMRVSARLSVTVYVDKVGPRTTEIELMPESAVRLGKALQKAFGTD